MNIILDDVNKTYDKHVLKDISLKVHHANAIAIIGKSGCGKSTLLRLLSGLERPDSGYIKIDETEIIEKNIKSYQDEIGMVFQQHNLFPHLSLYENIMFILTKGKKINKDLAASLSKRILTKLHLEDEMDKKPKFVSGGQAQRASIARAFVTDPKIIFMDEPTAALDPILTKEVLDTVVDLKDTGTDFIFVTHELSFVSDFADYVVFMNAGEIIEHGSVDILRNPKTKDLRRFLQNERSIHVS